MNGPGNPLWFGTSIDPGVVSLQGNIALARTADEVGLDLISVMDHPYSPSLVDTWTFLTALGVSTQRVRLLTNVINLPLRPAPMLAKAAATLDLLTNGRVELGLGAGARWDVIEGYGGPRHEPGEAVAALGEAIEIMGLLWQPEGSSPITFDGVHYSLKGARPGPAPAHRIGIWVGGNKPRILRMTGRLADGVIWSVPYVPPSDIPQVNQWIDEGAEEAGRSPSQIRRAYNVSGMILTGNVSAAAKRPGILVGPVDEWIDVLTGYARDLRFDTFNLWPAGPDADEQVRIFAQEVAPAVRQAVGESV